MLPSAFYSRLPVATCSFCGLIEHLERARARRRQQCFRQARGRRKGSRREYGRVRVDRCANDLRRRSKGQEEETQRAHKGNMKMRLKTRVFLVFSQDTGVRARGGGCLSEPGAWKLPGSVPEHNTGKQRLEAAKTKGPGEAHSQTHSFNSPVPVGGARALKQHALKQHVTGLPACHAPAETAHTVSAGVGQQYHATPPRDKRNTRVPARQRPPAHHDLRRDGAQNRLPLAVAPAQEVRLPTDRGARGSASQPPQPGRTHVGSK
jgi:hypothetical protein